MMMHDMMIVSCWAPVSHLEDTVILVKNQAFLPCKGVQNVSVFLTTIIRQQCLYPTWRK